MGTNFTDSTTATDIWAANTSGDRADDMTTTWFTTNDSTLEFTGVQLEVGSQATPFEHRSYAEEIQLCYRYYYKVQPGVGAYFGAGVWYSSTSFICFIVFPVVMRTSVSALYQSGTADHYKVIANGTTYTLSLIHI